MHAPLEVADTQGPLLHQLSMDARRATFHLFQVNYEEEFIAHYDS